MGCGASASKSTAQTWMFQQVNRIRVARIPSSCGGSRDMSQELFAMTCPCCWGVTPGLLSDYWLAGYFYGKSSAGMISRYVVKDDAENTKGNAEKEKAGEIGG